MKRIGTHHQARLRAVVAVAAVLWTAMSLTQAQPPADTRVISFDTDEGTFMCTDVSPDGRTILFDLLGDLYALPIDGGAATPILAGLPWDRCPRYSPDGTRVAFISDRAGLENVWVLDLATKNLRPLTDLPLPDIGITGVTGTPVWLPDGQGIAYRVSRLSRAQVHVVPARGGAARPLIPAWRLVDGQPAHGASSPAFSPDGRTVFVAGITAPPRQSAEGTERKNGETQLYRLETGSTKPVPIDGHTAGRDEFKPVLSRSGRWLAYGRSQGVRDQELRVRDLQSGDDRRLIALTDADDSAAGTDYVGDEIPGFAFTPDDRAIVIWDGGKIRRVDVADGTSRVIPFTVRVVREVAALVRGSYRIPDTPLQVRALRWPALSPDRRTLVFSAVGSLWTVQLPGGKPSRLTTSDDFEFMPSFSPDGRELAYVAFEHDGVSTRPPGRLLVRRTDTGETRRAIVDEAASYWMPSWSPDGTKLAVVREAGADRLAPTHYGWIDLAAKTFKEVAVAPHMASGNQRYVTPNAVAFTADGRELVYVDGPDDAWRIALRVARLDGGAPRTLMTGAADIVGFAPSPDLSRTVVLGWDYEAYLASLPAAGGAAIHVTIQDPRRKAALTRVSENGALYPRWLDRDTLLYGWTSSVFTARAGAARGERLATIDLDVPRRGGQGVFALQNARLVTLTGSRGAGEVIERGTIVVRDRRIAAIGPADRVAIPAGAATIDAAGLTIVPGFVDSHTHGLEGISLPAIPLGVTDRSLHAGLAFGVTTAWEATGRTSDDASLSRIELLEAGRLRGGRWFAAIGRFTLLEPHGVPYASYDEVRTAVFRKKALGGEQCLKNYFGKYRTTAQWIATAVREAGICVVGHVGNPPQLLSRAADGYSMDHPAMWTPAYRDIVEFLARTGAIWTPHDNFGRAATRPGYTRAMVEDLRAVDDGRAVRKVERFGGEASVKRWDAAPRVAWEDTSSARVARVAAAIVAAGGKVTASTDGTALLENHFQMWSLHRAGMSAGDVLRAATMTPAEKLGVQADVGSLMAGKLADFLVLTGNPLERIEHTLSLKYTVLAGLIYDSDTLDAVAPAAAAARRLP